VTTQARFSGGSVTRTYAGLRFARR